VRVYAVMQRGERPWVEPGRVLVRVLGSELLNNFGCCVGDEERLQAAGSLAIIAGLQEGMHAGGDVVVGRSVLRRAGGAVNVSGAVP
jgi:hypothetical protein